MHRFVLPRFVNFAFALFLAFAFGLSSSDSAEAARSSKRSAKYGRRKGPKKSSRAKKRSGRKFGIAAPINSRLRKTLKATPGTKKPGKLKELITANTAAIKRTRKGFFAAFIPLKAYLEYAAQPDAASYDAGERIAAIAEFDAAIVSFRGGLRGHEAGGQVPEGEVHSASLATKLAERFPGSFNDNTDIVSVEELKKVFAAKIGVSY